MKDHEKQAGIECKSNRRHKRFIITLPARVIIGGKSYEGVISNVSEEGMSSTITTFIKTDNHFSPQKDISLKFELPSGSEVELRCEIRWFLKPRDTDKNLMLGLYIVDPPNLYTEWIRQFA